MCRCPTCDLTKDFAIEYYNNNFILLDNEESIHIPKVIE